MRTHSEVELAHLEKEGVGLAVMAERELALGMMGYALRSLGLSDGEARLFVQSSLTTLAWFRRQKPMRERRSCGHIGKARENPEQMDCPATTICSFTEG